MRVTTKGQVTIPERIRRASGMLPGTEVAFSADQDGVRLTLIKSGPHASQREQQVADTLRRLRGSATIKMTTDEILALTRGE